MTLGKMVETAPDTFTITRRVYFSRRKRLWNWIMGRAGYDQITYTDCKIEGPMTIEEVDGMMTLSMNLIVPPQVEQIHMNYKVGDIYP